MPTPHRSAPHDFGDTRPMAFDRAASPAPVAEPPVWTLPGELAKLLKPPSTSRSQQADARRAKRVPAAQDQRGEGRPAPIDGAEPKASESAPPVSLALPLALPRSSTLPSRPKLKPLSNVSSESFAPERATPDGRALRLTAAVCLAGVLVVLAGAWWLQQRADDNSPSIARLPASHAAPEAVPEVPTAATLAPAALSEPIPPAPPLESAASSAGVLPTQQISVRRAAMLPLAAPRTAPPRSASPRPQPSADDCCAPATRATTHRCSELLLGQSLGDSRSLHDPSVVSSPTSRSCP